MRNLFPIESKEFGKRLDALMKSKNESSMDLAVKLLGLQKKPLSNEQEYKDCRNKEKTIKNHLSLGEISKQNSSKSLASCFIAEYCKHFECSPDYFFGNIDYPTHEQANIGNVTGLSPQSIETLKILKRSDYLDLINFMMNDYAVFGGFLSNIALYFNNNFDTPVHYDEEIGIFVESKDIADSPILNTNGEKYVSIGRRLNYEVAGQPAYETLSVPVSIIESHAMHCLQQQLDNWKNKYKKDKGSD